MSTVRSDLSNSHLRNYSFTHEDISFANVNLPNTKKYNPIQQSPTKTHKYIQQYQMNRQNIVPKQPLLPTTIIKPIDTLTDHQFLIQEIRRLQDLVYFMGTKSDKLQSDCEQYKLQINYLKICQQKYKQQTQAQLRKLKQVANDKTNQCQVVAKNARRDKQALQQQADRLKFNLKSVIQKKNDELFNLSRQKDRQIHNAKQQLQNTIDQLQTAHRKTNDQNKSIISRLNDEIQHLKQKYDKMSQQYNKLDEQFQKQKIRIFEQNQANLSQLKQKYYRNKLLLIETSQEEVRILEDSSQLQRDVFMLELQKMREQIDRVTKQNKQITQQSAINDASHGQNIQNYEKLIQNLKNKLNKLQTTKQQQLQALKIKIGVLHSQNLRAVQSTYLSRINSLQDKIKAQNSQIQRLQAVIKNELEKNHTMGLKLRRKQLQIDQELAKLKLMHSNAEQALRLKYETQKSMIIQQSAQAIKNYQAKAGNLQFYEEQLRKLRNQLAAKTQQSEEQEDSYQQRSKQWERQRQQLIKRNKILLQTIQENNHQAQRQLQAKNRQIAQLNDKILKTIREAPLPDYSSFEKQIQNLKQELSSKVEVENNWKQKCELAEKKCRQYQQQFEKIHLQGDMIINQAKAEWQAITQQKIDQLHHYYNHKCDSLQHEKQQLKNIKEELQTKTTRLVLQYKQLQNTLSQVMSSLKKRSELEQKVVQLGLDINLVRNKQQLFQQ